jgi:hypothetical protein
VHASLATSFVLLTSQLTFRFKPIVPVATFFATAPFVNFVSSVSNGVLGNLRFFWLRIHQSNRIVGNRNWASSALICHRQPPLSVYRKMHVVTLRHAGKELILRLCSSGCKANAIVTSMFRRHLASSADPRGPRRLARGHRIIAGEEITTVRLEGIG